jgi:hypothetical protein
VSKTGFWDHLLVVAVRQKSREGRHSLRSEKLLHALIAAVRQVEKGSTCFP